MAYFAAKKCPKCGKLLTLTPEASKIGVVCPQCRSFVGEKNSKMTEEEIKKLTSAIHEMMKR